MSINEEAKFTHSSNYSISTRDADFKSDLRVSSLVNFFIQSAWKHAEELGFGYSHLSQLGVGWIFSRFKIKIHSLPKWPADFTITTWPKGMDRILYIRDAEVHDSAGKKLASITSAWLVIDYKTKRPKRSLPEADFFAGLDQKSAIEEAIPSLCFEGKPAFSTNFIVRNNDIDMNMHLTTVRYIDFIFDTYQLEFLNKNNPYEISVNFIKEIPFGAELVMHRFENSNTHSFELINLNSNTVCFRGEVKYKTKK